MYSHENQISRIQRAQGYMGNCIRWTIVVDKDFNILEFSEGAEKITDFNKEKVLGNKCYKVLRSNLCETDCPLKRILKTGKALLSFAAEIKNSNGNPVFICANVTPIRNNSNGEIEKAVLNFRSISEVYKLTSQLFKEKAKLQAILDSIADGVFTIDTEAKITSFNPAAERITGYRKEEVIGKPCRLVFKSECCGECCPLKETIRTGKVISDFEMEIITARGDSIPISVSTALLIDEEGEIIGGVETFRDLSTIKKLSEELKERYSFGNIIGKNKKMQEVYRLIKSVSDISSTVLICGETGTGKDLVARAIHYNSRRKDKLFIKVSCAALPEALLESEFFGYKKGAFTGAIKNKPGKFQLANGGTIFLDEIEDLPISVQVKLLRVLEEQEFEPLGGTETIKVDVRIIAATNTDLEKAMREGKFREDLYYRLNVVKIHLSPLRERKDDIPLLTEHFIKKFNKKTGKKNKGRIKKGNGTLYGVLLAR